MYITPYIIRKQTVLRHVTRNFYMNIAHTHTHTHTQTHTHTERERERERPRCIEVYDVHTNSDDIRFECSLCIIYQFCFYRGASAEMLLYFRHIYHAISVYTLIKALLYII